MTGSETDPNAAGLAQLSPESLSELRLQLEQLRAETRALEQDNKSLRLLVEKVIANRQQSHSELVVLLTTLVSKLPINDVGILVSRLVEHNNSVNHFLSALVRGNLETTAIEPAMLKNLEQVKQDLTTAVGPLVQELIDLDVPLESRMLEAVAADPECFFSPGMARAWRCFVKGQLPRERIVRVFGEQAIPLFNDMTTDPKRNARPKPEEIVLGFKSDFETQLPKCELSPEARENLLKLFQQAQLSKGSSDRAKAQKAAFQKLSFIIELLHYYQHQHTEPADVIFAQRLPVLIEQLAASGSQEQLDENLLRSAEQLLNFILNHDHRLMVINNIGKSGGIGRTLKCVLRLRVDKVPDLEQIVPEFVKHLIPVAPQKPPAPETVAALLHLLPADAERVMLKSIMATDRIRKEDAEALGKAVANTLGLKGILDELKSPVLPLEVERQIAWGKIHDLVLRRANPTAIADAIRDRIHAKYDAEEMKSCWVELTEADPISLIRVFSHLPYLPNGKTDPVARPLMETCVTRLTHEKYSATYLKVLNSLKSMHKAKPDSPTLVNFIALVKWIDAAAAQKICADIGMPFH